MRHPGVSHLLKFVFWLDRSAISLLNSLQAPAGERDLPGNAHDPSQEFGQYCFAVSIFGLVIFLEASSADLIALLDRSVFPSIPRTRMSSAYADVSIRVVETASGFHLYRNQVLVASVAQLDVLTRLLIDCIDRSFIEGVKNLYAIHAGAVLLGDRALLLPGASHAGKSSLVAELLRRGATCLSDEYALIDGAGLVHSYPRPLLMRDSKQVQTPVLPSQFKAKTASRPARVGWILSLGYQPDGSWNVKSVPQSLALMSILQNTPHTLEDSPRMLSFFERAVASAQCFAGSRGECVDAADQILRLAAS